MGNLYHTFSSDSIGIIMEDKKERVKSETLLITTKKQCFLDTMGHLNVFTHSGYDSKCINCPNSR